MSAFAKYLEKKRSLESTSTPTDTTDAHLPIQQNLSQPSSSAAANILVPRKEHEHKPDSCPALSQKGKEAAKRRVLPFKKLIASFDLSDDLFAPPSLDNLKHPTHQPTWETEETVEVDEGEADADEHQTYIRTHCRVPVANLNTFDELVGVPLVIAFADEFEKAAGRGGAVRPVSGLLLFGPSGTGKSACAQAIAHYLNGALYQFGSADLPNGKAGAQRIDALFAVALAGEKPAIIFVDECDTLLSTRAVSRVGHLAKTWGRFTDDLLVIGATNEPQDIAPKILTGRFERKILLDNPCEDARHALIVKQLGQETGGQVIEHEEIEWVVSETEGRSAVNIERLVSTAVLRAGMLPVVLQDFEDALEEEPSDYDAEVAKRNREFNQKYGWRRKC